MGFRLASSSANRSIRPMTYRLKRQSSGVLAVHNPALGETMHPVRGPWEEATRLYVQGSGLPALLSAPASRTSAPAGEGSAGEVVVFDVGLGAAANALAALACRAELISRHGRARRLRLVSFENDLEPLRFALAHAAQLGYLLGHEPILETLAAQGSWSGAGGASWELRLGDFPRTIRQETRRADVVFFDPFSPRTNPDMWSVSTLEGLYGCRRPGGEMRLVTYSSAFSTRAAMLLAGFFVGAGLSLDGRRRATEAAAYYSSLDEPLDLRWLSRWKRDREPWPCLTPAGQRRRVRLSLLEHPQWAHFAQAVEQGREARGRRRAGGAARTVRPAGRRKPARGAAKPPKSSTRSR